jgi:hypothetical protein
VFSQAWRVLEDRTISQVRFSPVANKLTKLAVDLPFEVLEPEDLAVEVPKAGVPVVEEVSEAGDLGIQEISRVAFTLGHVLENLFSR